MVSSDGLGATLEQYRPDQVSHTLQVQVTNRSGRAVRLGGVRLVWPGLVTIAPSLRADLVSDGQTIDLTVDYGVAVCASPPSGDETPPDAPAVVEADATWDDGGAPQPVVFPVTDRRGVLSRLFVPSCRAKSW